MAGLYGSWRSRRPDNEGLNNERPETGSRGENLTSGDKDVFAEAYGVT